MEPIAVDGGKGTVELGADGILHLVWKPGIVLEGDDVHAAMARVNEISDGSEYPMLVNMGTTKAVTRQAKSAFKVPCAASRIALLGSSPVDRVIANFTIERQTLPCPTRFFTSRDEAVGWLLQTPVP
ncbi:MAG TPA: STAS/SEC14 domain-containing protein [Arthrobacter sp.]|nr:STAS/SEC14 domain-containing protein [Arthrobacter sp.]